MIGRKNRRPNVPSECKDLRTETFYIRDMHIGDMIKQLSRKLLQSVLETLLFGMECKLCSLA